jgi:hypothetical protein
VRLQKDFKKTPGYASGYQMELDQKIYLKKENLTQLSFNKMMLKNFRGLWYIRAQPPSKQINKITTVLDVTDEKY